MNKESFLKSEIAKNITISMLRSCGCKVLSFKDNNLIDFLIEEGFERSKMSKKILNMPDLVIIHKKKILLASVKFSAKGRKSRNIDWGFKQTREFWPGSLLFVVLKETPYFLVSEGASLVEGSNSFLRINKKTSEEFARLVNKFL